MLLKLGVFLLGIAAILLLLILLVDGHGVVIGGICGPSPLGLVLLLGFFLIGAVGVGLIAGGLVRLLVRKFPACGNHA